MNLVDRLFSSLLLWELTALVMGIVAGGAFIIVSVLAAIGMVMDCYLYRKWEKQTYG